MKRDLLIKVYAFLFPLLLLAGCSPGTGNDEITSPGSVSQEESTEAADAGPGSEETDPVTYKVDPETFSLEILKDHVWIPVSLPLPGKRVEGLIRNDQETRWSYPDEEIDVAIRPRSGYLEVSIASGGTADHQFDWPGIAGETYYLPLGEGKRVPAGDAVWAEHLSGQEFDLLEQFSMPFWAVAHGDHAVTYILENPYRNTLKFSRGEQISFILNHRYPEIDERKDHVFRISVTGNDPAAAAKFYRSYVIAKGDFVTLAEKAEINPEIRKLYGAPHIYLAGDLIVSPEDINWQQFRAALISGEMEHLLAYGLASESGQEIPSIAGEITGQDYVSNYQKHVVCRYLSEVLKRSDFIATGPPAGTGNPAAAKSGEADASSVIQGNKHALAAAFPAVFQPADSWMSRETTALLEDMKASGIDQAWIGLHSWEQAFAKPELTDTAAGLGYLIGPYDSYHSIHEPGAEQWVTAAFPDAALYDEATATDKNGEFYAGFQNVGRKLNPVLSLPAVSERVEMILNTPVRFNSWFIDCDATGEIYDDYSPQHRTTQQQDLQARLERMAYIRDSYGMVIGSEGGHDFAAGTIAFAHGIELKSFAWMDEDMKSNQQSEYYLGKYYNPGGGVPEYFARRVPVKEHLYKVFAAPEYDLPLFKLVYNDSVITTYHWDWSTFKMIGATKDRMLREVLYNVPPLYHLDSTEWERYKADLMTHTAIWSAFSRQVINLEMTGFEDLGGDGNVQLCRYGEEITVIANFSDEAFVYEGTELAGHSLLMINGSEVLFYSPQAAKEHQ